MKKVGFSVLMTLVMVTGANAATLYMTGTDGSNKITIENGFSEDMQIRLDTKAVDSIKIAFINAFLDTSSDVDDVAMTSVTAVTAGNGAPWVYDRSAFIPMPAELEFLGDEYGLVSGDATPTTGGYATGTATYIHDTLTVANTGANMGTVNVTFELGARTPQAFGPGPTFLPYVTAPGNFPEGFPNFLYVGDKNSNNPAFGINLIPEPASLALLALGGLAALRRR